MASYARWGENPPKRKVAIADQENLELCAAEKTFFEAMRKFGQISKDQKISSEAEEFLLSLDTAVEKFEKN